MSRKITFRVQYCVTRLFWAEIPVEQTAVSVADPACVVVYAPECHAVYMFAVFFEQYKHFRVVFRLSDFLFFRKPFFFVGSAYSDVHFGDTDFQSDINDFF